MDLTKGKSCETKLITSYHKTTSFVDVGKAVAVYLDFVEVFDTVCRILLLDKCKVQTEWVVCEIGRELAKK